MPLRSNFEAGSTRWAVRRSQWRSLGLTDEEMERPKIAIVNSSSSLSVCFSHLDSLAQVVAEGIRAAGGVPFEIRTVAPSDFVTSAGKSARYLMPSRDLITNDIEAAVEGAVLDGMVCLASCDKTTPGQLMAAGRLDIPTLLVIGGYQLGGYCNGGPVDIDDVYESVGSVAAGTKTIEELREMTEHAIVPPGVCAGLGTANTMHIMAEALGMTVPGSAPIRADSEAMRDRAVEAAHLIVEAVLADRRPRRIMTTEAFENAVVVDLAVSGSINSARHLQAIAEESSVAVDIYGMIEELSVVVPTLTSIRPNGSDRIEDFERAGGTRALMAQLRDRLNLEAMTVTGRRLRDIVEDVAPGDQLVIRSPSNPVAPSAGLTLFRGSLAPEGAVVKVGAFPDQALVFHGRARVFESEEKAIEAMAGGRLNPGDAVVLRYLGPRGGPGTVFAASFVAALNGAGLADSIACVTDGELSGLNRGITIGQVMPEAADGGPLAVVQEGDEITIDVPRRRVDLVIEGSELRRRIAEWVPPARTNSKGLLGQYRSLVQPLSRGAILEGTQT